MYTGSRQKLYVGPCSIISVEETKLFKWDPDFHETSYGNIKSVI